jgi:hypothetical protein
MKDRRRASRESMGWTLAFGRPEDRSAATREAAMATFAKGGGSGRRGQAGWRLDSERFRSAPTTCGRFRGILSLR